MTSLLNIIRKTIFWLSIFLIVLTIYSLTFGQFSNYEFADYKVSSQFYETIMEGLPLAILLTLTGTIKRTHEKSRNIGTIVVTVLISIISFFIMVSLIFSVGFLTITNDLILYQLKSNPKIIITKQTIGQGALGSDGYRIVQLQPFMIFWNKVSIVDTTTINKNEWTFINEKIDN